MQLIFTTDSFIWAPIHIGWMAQAKNKVEHWICIHLLIPSIFLLAIARN